MIFKDCIFELESGKREKGGALKSGVPSLGAEHLNECGSFNLDLSKMKYISYDFFCKMRKGKVRKGDIILVKDGATTGKVSFIDDLFPFEDVAVNEHVFLIRTKEGYFSKYVFYLLFSEFGRRNVLNDFRGATVGGISKDFVNFNVSIPSMEEQRDIVNRLDILQQIIDLRRKQINGLEEIIKSQFVKMFGDVIKNTNKYEYLAIGEVTEIVTGTTPNTNKEEYWNGNINWLTPAEIDNDAFYIQETERKITESGMKSKALKLMPKGTVIFSTRAPIGKTAIINKEMCCNQGFKNCICMNKINNIYLFCLLKFNKEYFDFLGTGATFKEISKSKFANIRISIPPIKLQNQFAEIVKQNYKQKFEIQKSLEKIQSLQENLMNKYFN